VADLAGTPSLWAVEGDLATLYCGCTPEGSGNPVDPACVRRAYDTYKNCVKTAEARAALRLSAAAAAFAGCIVACALWGPLGPGCALGCMGGYALAIALILGDLAIDMNSCREQLKIDLRACGVVINEH